MHLHGDMKKFLIIILILVVAAGTCVVSCPDKTAHTEALKGVLNAAFTEEMGGNNSDDPLAMVGSMIGTGIGGIVIDNMLKVDNYFVCSVGTITFDGKTRVVSVGVLNHVFAPGEDGLRKAVKDLCH